jgi:energy-coupling factor transport system permease protein
MESRGFGIRGERTWARPSRFARRDAVLVAGGLGIAVAATAAGIAAGTWQLVLS